MNHYGLQIPCPRFSPYGIWLSRINPYLHPGQGTRSWMMLTISSNTSIRFIFDIDFAVNITRRRYHFKSYHPVSGKIENIVPGSHYILAGGPFGPGKLTGEIDSGRSFPPIGIQPEPGGGSVCGNRQCHPQCQQEKYHARGELPDSSRDIPFLSAIVCPLRRQTAAIFTSIRCAIGFG